ncbi:MAG: LEA type 2 family protein, partial [Planctomycetes bacterium]|nr:LEA type 2 family protein [Planctomycetota bacterium]
KDVENFVVAPGAPVTVRLKFANRAAVPFAGKAKVTLRTAYDAPLWERELDVKLKPRGEDALAVPVATKGLRKGVYVLRSAVGDLVKTETLFAVCDSDPIPFAKEGDFLYGSGVGGKWTDGYRLDWARFMGVDLVRNCERGEGQDNRENLNAAIAELKKRGFPCGHLIMDPPYRPDAAERRKLVEKAGDFLRWAAAEHRDFLRFIEIGNEPDLPFFYAGSTDEYVEGMAALAKAAKEGNPQAVVMNGGLCFHGADGWRRAHEIVGKTPDGLLGAWAYHGHGPGAAAERNAWNRQQKALKDANKKLLPCIETESGMFANDPVTWRRQAQTAVEKIVFAQSVGAPTFLWFAIYMYGGDWGYTSVEREHEPRPAVLAYRTMTKHLKGLRFVKTLDLLAPEAEAYCFAAPDGRRALVLWSDRGEITRAVSLGEDAAATVSDLYDNREKAVAVAPGLLQLTIGADPTFVAWTSKDKDAAVSLPKPPLAAPAELPLVPGKDATLAVTVRNPTDAELRGELKLSRMGAAPISFAAPTLPVAVPARGEKRVEVKVQTADAVPSFWPRQWRVFLPVEGEVDLASFKAVPDSVEGRKGKVAGRACVAPGGALDFGALNGGFAEKKQALCFAEIDSPRDLEAEFGAAADWWMQWFVNGKEVYSTMDRGNGGPQSLLTHRFKVKLRQGRNLVAARVLSGSGGWRLVAGGPDEVAAA